jgi:hypothetical protein
MIMHGFSKSWDQNGVGIVKVHCIECVKDFGGCTRDHSKVVVSNLFSNFIKSHIISTAHIRSWYCRKGVNFYNNPQFAANKGKSIIMSMDDHRRAVTDGLEIMHRVKKTHNPKISHLLL